MLMLTYWFADQSRRQLRASMEQPEYQFEGTGVDLGSISQHQHAPQQQGT